MKHWIAFPVFILFILSDLLAQKTPPREYDLVINGDFEEGNKGFTSDFMYGRQSAEPGQYSITSNAGALNADFRSPTGGDHTEGYGSYMVVNSSGEDGRKAWCTNVTVIPNSNYRFSVYFCNLYKRLPATTSFVFDDGDVKGNDPEIKLTVNNKPIATDRDFYHLFKWVKASVMWYSGTHRGPVNICIENINSNISGNDLALDDIEFVFIETMPDGYKPPGQNTIMSEEFRTQMAMEYLASNRNKRRRIVSLDGLEKGDSLAPGIYTIRYTPRTALEDSLLANRGEKIQLNNLMFDQTKADLLPEAKRELDLLASWLEKEGKLRIRFSGHTDNIGDPDLNLKLSQERVQKVKEYLVAQGVAPERIEIIGYGGAFPIADNSKEETRKLNRRVEFEILK